jgi:hypothetical protein
MPVAKTLEGVPEDPFADDTKGSPRALLDRGKQLLGDDEDEVVRVGDQDVALLGMDCDGQVRRDRPRRRGPDERGRGLHRAVGDSRRREDLEKPQGFGETKRDVDRRVLALLVLELRFRERRLVGEAPAHGLERAVDEILGVEPSERPRDLRFVCVAHRRIGPVPPAADSEPPELLALDVDELLGILAAGPSDRDRVHVALLRAELLVHFLLDRQSMAVPPRDVRRVVAGERPAPHDDVLQDLVQRRPEVNRAVGVWRPVVQQEPGPTGGGRAQPLLEAHLLPCLEPKRFPSRQVRLHREVRAREVQRRLVVARFGHGEARQSNRRGSSPSGPRASRAPRPRPPSSPCA